jgi:osmoprotectant transport system ATP-binding protein
MPEDIPALSGQAAEIVFDGVSKTYRGRREPAVDDLSITIPAGEICVLVGPSGGGKTTAMKLVNRLIDLTEGDIRIDGRSVRSLDETDLRRGIGYVIQQIGLFPHMTVAGNIATLAPMPAWASCSNWWDWTRTGTASATPPSSPAASASGSGWPGRWRRTRR